MKGILLGAGASYDCGMPLVWELTAEIRRWLTKPKLAQYNNGWKLQGGGWDDYMIFELEKLLDNKNIHYEEMIGNIETLFSRERNEEIRQRLHTVHGFLLQAVYGLLLERQIKNMKYAMHALYDYGGFKKMAEENRPLWVFSLNHDLIVELLASKLFIPVKSGFNDTVSIPMRFEPNANAQRINFQFLSRDSIESSKYDFFKQGELGVNLIKLHGALDIFGYKDELNYLKILPQDNRPESYVDQLLLVNDINQKTAVREASQHRSYIVNENIYFDEFGDLQFLRKSILSGAHKFSKQISQIAPSEFLHLFRDHLNSFDELICIGYSFADSHIDQILKNWLSFSPDKKLTIVNPGIDRCPSHFNCLHSQVTCICQGASDYFLGIEEIPGNTFNQEIRAIRKEVRKKIMKDLIG